MLSTFSSIGERSFPFGSRLQDGVGDGLPLTMQVKSTCSPAAPGIFVYIGVDVRIVGRAVTNFDYKCRSHYARQSRQLGASQEGDQEFNPQQRLFSFVRTDWPDHSRRNENFTFNQNYPARSVKS